MKINNGKEPIWHLQWHITDDCKNKCIHCYNRNHSGTKQTSKKDFVSILNDFISANKKWKTIPQISFIGGDPMLHPDLKYFIEYINKLKKENKIYIQIAGNPETLNDETIKWLSRRIDSFQLSLDGCKKFHDEVRYKGSFDTTVDCIKRAKKIGLSIDVMTTVLGGNLNQLTKVMEIAYVAGASNWAFSRHVPKIGMDNGIDSYKYRSALIKIREQYSKAKYKKYALFKKESFWYPSCVDRNIGNINKRESKKIVSGCGVGTLLLSILPDSTIMACRRHEGSRLGKWKKPGDILNYFFNSPVMQKLRDIEKITKCKDCMYLYNCRGCRAIGYAVRANYFDPDPNCVFYQSIGERG